MTNAHSVSLLDVELGLYVGIILVGKIYIYIYIYIIKRE